MSINAGEFNGENNKKIMKKYKGDDVKPWMKKYCSTARTLVRGAWFFDFLACLIGQICHDRTAKTSKMAVKAYDTGLAPHHPWALRKTAGLALKAIKSREKFLKSLLDEQTLVTGAEYSEEKFYEDFSDIHLNCEKLAKQLWTLVRENGFDKLP